MSGRGESLVEVVVALLILAVGALAVAAGIGHAQRARGIAQSTGIALAAAEGWLEAWRAAPAAGSASGVEVVSWGSWNAALEWETASVGPCVESARVTVTTAGASPVRLSSRRQIPGAGSCGA